MLNGQELWNVLGGWIQSCQSFQMDHGIMHVWRLLLIAWLVHPTGFNWTQCLYIPYRQELIQTLTPRSCLWSPNKTSRKDLRFTHRKLLQLTFYIGLTRKITYRVRMTSRATRNEDIELIHTLVWYADNLYIIYNISLIERRPALWRGNRA